MARHTQNYTINLKKLLVFIYMYKVDFILHGFLWDIARILQTCYFGYFGNDRLRKPKVILSICRKFWYLFLGKKLTSFPTFFGGYCKDMPISYFGYFGHVWLRTPKMMVSTCRQLRCLSACLKWTSLFAFFLRYYILKNPEIWLANSFWNIYNLFLLNMSISNDLVIKNDLFKKKNPSLFLWRGFNCITTKSWY